MKGQFSPRRVLGGDWLKVAMLGLLLAFALFFVFFYHSPAEVKETGERVVLVDETPVPELDRELLAQAKDGTRTQRLVMEQEPLQHLLEKSLRIVPSVAAKLNMPEQPVPVAKLRASPDRYRGRYLWYEGTLKALGKGKPGHPVPGYRIHEGRLETPAGDPVLFYFSTPPPEDLRVGHWVRMEGYFLKLRDTNLPVKIDLAPVLVGPELSKAYADWEAVEELDPSVLARVRDGVLEAGVIADEQDMRLTLDQSQTTPLWHLASYAMHQAETRAPEQTAAIPAFVRERDWRDIEFGRTPKGTPFRLLGTFQIARSFSAKSNPLGIEWWTEAWIQCRDLGGRTVPIWLPTKLEPNAWKRNMSVMVPAYFFKRYLYETVNGEDRYAPLFVAHDLERFALPKDILHNQITMVFAGIVILVIGIFLFTTWRDRRRSAAHEERLVQRRKRRREKLEAAGRQA